MLMVENDKNANILKIVDLATKLTDEEVRDLTNIAIGITIAREKSKAS